MTEQEYWEEYDAIKRMIHIIHRKEDATSLVSNGNCDNILYKKSNLVVKFLNEIMYNCKCHKAQNPKWDSNS